VQAPFGLTGKFRSIIEWDRIFGHRFVNANNERRSEGSTFFKRVNNARFTLSLNT
jgi:hypothetical protein